MFGLHGPSAPMSLIWTTADVSPGVLYRHFPDRESLAHAVIEQNVEALEKIAARPDCTLDDLLAAVLDQLVECSAFVDARRPGDHHDPGHAATALRFRALLEEKLGTGHTFRPGTTAGELVLAVGLVSALLTKTAAPLRRTVAADAWQLLTIGLRDTGAASAPLAPEG